MATNISKEKREKLIEKINAIKTYIQQAPQDKNTKNLLTYIAEIEKDIKGKKYGLVFEEHKEAIDEILENHVPILKEDESLFIDNGGQMNFLIEGDNLASLQLLEKTHKGKIDLIYIDPPYNTGKKDFIYDDEYVDFEDSFKHSKWLSFMEKRLKIAKNLLTPTGVIFISIDDNELYTLKLLCDEIFDNSGFINNFMWLHGKGKKNKQSRTLQQYILAYSKIDRDQLPAWYIEHLAKGSFSNPDNDARGKWFSGSISFSEERSNKNSDKYFTITSPSGIKWSRQWMCTQVEMNEYLKNNKIYFGKPPLYNHTPRLKIFPTDSYVVIPDNIFSNVGTTRSAQNELDKLIGKRVDEKGHLISKFNNPKSHELIEHLIKISNNSNPLQILDFFAGSGTTGHAVMRLNAEDGGNRKFILCTNNENNICRDITYERIKRVIEKEKYKASLKYMKVDFVPITDKFYYEYADELLKHVKELVELENGINFNGNKELAIIITEEELDNFMNNIPAECKTIYLGHDILPNQQQEEMFKSNKIKVNIIPDYYYRDLEG